MGRLDELPMQRSMRPSVYTLSDHQLAEEYKELTGASVEVPSSRDPVSWRKWRNDLQLRVLAERVAHPRW